jgi:hypothetical protein
MAGHSPLQVLWGEQKDLQALRIRHQHPAFLKVALTPLTGEAGQDMVGRVLRLVFD